MAYKVNYYTLAILLDGRTGNVLQNTGVAYTNEKIENIPKIINEFLSEKKLVAVIQDITEVKGMCI